MLKNSTYYSINLLYSYSSIIISTLHGDKGYSVCYITHENATEVILEAKSVQ